MTDPIGCEFSFVLRIYLCQFIQKFLFTCATISQNSSFIHDFRHSINSNSILGIRHSDRLNVSNGYAFSPLPPSFAHAAEKNTFVFLFISFDRSLGCLCLHLCSHSSYSFIQTNHNLARFGFVVESSASENTKQQQQIYFFLTQKKNSLFSVFLGHVQTHRHISPARAIHRCTA